MKCSLSLVILVVGSVAWVKEAAWGAALSADALRPQGTRIASLRNYSYQELAVPQSGATSFRVQVRCGDVPYELALERHSVRSADFRVFVQQEDGALLPATEPDSQTYQGHVDGVPGGRVAAVVSNVGLSAVVVMDSGARWYIEPVDSSAMAASRRRMHIVYQGEDVASPRRVCGATGGLAEPPVGAVAALPDPMPAGTSVLRVADIAFDADTEFFQANGRSVAKTVNDIEMVMNGISMLYESQLQITYEITTIIVRTSEPDPYTATDHAALLAEFRTEWNADELWVHRDIAHLMTGKELDAGVIGTANYAAMCQVCAGANGYGLSQSRFTDLLAERVYLTAHELGHSWGAVHCDGQSDCGLMCSSLGGCWGSPGQFDAVNATTVENAAATLPCIATIAPPASFPFCDTFDAGVNNGAWSYNAAASVSVLSQNPPSPPYALLIDDCCAPCAPSPPSAPDEIRTNFIPLGGIDGGVVIYYTEHAGGALTAGSQLVVEYWSVYGDWVELNRVASDGIDQTQFDRWVHDLPPDALHDQFRIRFRLEPVSSSDAWYVDNVAVQRSAPISSALHVRQGASGDATGETWESAYKDLTDALSVAACAGGAVREVWVAAGTYKPDRGTGDRASTFRLVNGVALLGGFVGDEATAGGRAARLNETVLSGDIGVEGFPGDNCYHVVSGGSTGGSAVLDGFTVRDGNATETTSDGGGGLRLTGSAATIRDCSFTANTGRNGGAIRVASLGSPTISRCSFFDNTALASGGGVHIGSGCTAIVDRCAMFENLASAFGGGVYCGGGLLDIRNSLLVGNQASSGAAVYNLLGNVQAMNCTVTSNIAAGSVGGILNSNASATINSSILWGNHDVSGALQSSQLSGASLNLNYSCVQGLTGSLGGLGNTSADPRFVDSLGADSIAGTADDDLRLLGDSPAIDSGDPVADAGNQSTDLVGHPRVLCGRVDIGAYEYGILDSNCDRAVDLADFAAWLACMAGPDAPTPDPTCRTFDADASGSVDLRDFALFQMLCLSP